MNAHIPHINTFVNYHRRWLAVLSAIALAICLGASPGVSAQEAAADKAVAFVNVNTASEEALAQALTGVGAVTAQEIVRHRELYGPFKTVDDLVEVKGIGKATLNKNRQRITLE